MMKKTRMVLQTLLLLSLAIAALPKQSYAQSEAAGSAAKQAQGQRQQQPSVSREQAAHPSRSEQELAATSNEATPGEQSRDVKQEEAGRNDQFKYSKSVQWFARTTGLDVHRAFWIFETLNFVIIAAAMLWIFKKVWPGMIRARNERISRGLEEARRASAEANTRLGSIEARLSRLSGEISEMRTRADGEGKAEEARIAATAEEEKRRILAAAEQEITSASAQARRELKAFAAEIAVNSAKNKITAQMNAESDGQLIEEFAQRLGREGRA